MVKTYFKIKSQEELPFSNFVCMWFKKKGGGKDVGANYRRYAEVSVGKLNNVPTLLEKKKLEDKEVFHTDPDGITRRCSMITVTIKWGTDGRNKDLPLRQQRAASMVYEGVDKLKVG